MRRAESASMNISSIFTLRGNVMIILLLALILVPVPALSASYAFSGASADLITYQGSFTVNLDQPLGLFNNLANTVSYPVTSWTMTATSQWEYLPSHTFTSANSTAGFCTGTCVFGSGGNSTVLQIWSGNGVNTGLNMRLTFNSPTLWDRASHYALNSAPMAMVTSGTLTSVPEPDLFWPIGIGFVISMIASWSSDRLGQYRRSRPRLEMPRL